MTAATQHPRHHSLILTLGTASGLVCFALFQAAYWLTTWLTQSAGERSLWGQPALSKALAAAFVLLIAFAVTYAWDKIRVKYRLTAPKYWAMIGLALSICLAAALLSGGF